MRTGTTPIRALAAACALALIPIYSAVDATAGGAGLATVGSFVRAIGGPGHAGLYGWGTATETDGSILVGDYWNFRIVQYQPDGTFMRYLITGNRGVGPGLHASPYGLAVDPRNGNFYVGDVDGGPDVEEYSPSGTYLAALTYPGINYPAYVAVANNGDVFVADARASKIVRFTRGGGTGTVIATVNKARGIGVDAAEDVYVNDASAHQVDVFTATGAPVRHWAVPGADLRGLAVDQSHGYVYSVGAQSNMVGRYNLDGTGALYFGGAGTANGKFTGGGRGATVDHSGNLWVGDMGNFRAQEFTSAGSFVRAVPNPPQPPPCPGFNGPIGVGIDTAGDVFVSDTFNQRVEKLSPDGKTCLAVWGGRGKSAFGFNYPRGLAVDRRDGSVIVGDTDNARVDKFDNKGGFLWMQGGTGSPSGQVKADGIAVASTGTIYATDFMKARIVVLSASGGYLGSLGSGLKTPRGVAVDADGSVWVTDTTIDRVVHFSSSGSVLGTIASAALPAPWGIVLDAAYIYVSDADTGQVTVWTRAGQLVGSLPGVLHGPHGMDLASGSLYVAEQGSDRVSQYSVP